MAEPKIKYDIEANVKGDAEVGQLASKLEALAGTLDGELKTSALASADALRQLGAKDNAVQNFVALKQSAQDAATRLLDAQAAAQQMGQTLAATQTPTRAQTGQMAKLGDAVRAAKAEVTQQNLAVQNARDTLSQYGVSTKNLIQSQRDLKTAIGSARTEVDAIVLSNAKAAAAAQAAADKQNKIAAAVSASNAKAVEMAKSAAAAREQIAQQSLAAERARQQFVEQYQLKEQLGQQALLARSREIAAQYPRLAAAAQTAGQQQVQANKQVESGLDKLKGQLSSLRNIAVAALGGSYVGSLAKDVLATADAYNNLQARIKLVTGEGAAFESAFEGVSAVAQRTSSNLESTGTLFAKLAQAGQAMGVGQAEALKLTETVNQAVQLSGASAQASDAAIVQLIQGLQGGVLRGDEFNSVMEQSPRLAKALADGLGTTTGALRKMAEAGQLSSEVVIKALQGQSDAVAAEFDKLPPTVGRAIQNLSTSWTLYVGETDKAMGASSAAASAISALSNNLSTVAGFLLDAGQAAAALAAIRLAQYFLGVGAAATTATTAVVANTAAVTAAGAAGTAAAVGVGRFAAILSSLKLFSLVGIVTNFHDIGTAIGQGIAKLAGYKDKTDELAAAEKTAAIIAADTVAMRQRMAAATQLAIDKSFELGNAGRASIAEFDKLTKAGSTAAEAVAKIGKDFDLSTVPGIQNAAAVLDKLAADGKLSADQFQKAWGDALKGADLAVFETNARAAFAGTAREAERLGQVLDATLRESIKRTGLDFDVISGGMGKAAKSALNDTDAIIAGLDKLKAMGVDTAQVLTASIGKGINTADSQKAIEAVRLQIEAVRKVLGDKVADGLLDQAKRQADELKDALEKARPGVDSLREAMKLLGVVSDQTLKDTAAQSKKAFDEMRNSGSASIRELSEGFKKYAADAIAANNGVASESIKAQAAMYGMEVQVDKTGKAIVRAMGEGTEAVGRHKETVDQTTGAYEALKNKAYEAVSAIGKARAAEAAALRKDGQFLAAGQTEDDARREDALAANQAAFAAQQARNNFAISIPTTRSIFENAKGQGLTDAQALQIAQTFLPLLNQQGGLVGRQNGETASTDLQKAIDRLVLQNAAAKAGADARGGPLANSTTTAAKTYTVNVNLGGSSTAINTSSDADARALIDLLARAKLSA